MKRIDSKLFALKFKTVTDEEKKTEQDRRNRDSATNALRASGCPSRVIAALVGLDETEPMRSAREFVAAPRDEKWWLVMLGNVGSGKSTAAAWAARMLLFRLCLAEQPGGTHREHCRWLTGAELGRIYTHDRDAARDWEALKRASVLVIDDLGTEGADSRSAEALWELVEARTNNIWPTVLTSNLTASEFKKRYGERIADRIRSCSVILESRGVSLRGVVK